MVGKGGMVVGEMVVGGMVGVERGVDVMVKGGVDRGGWVEGLRVEGAEMGVDRGVVVKAAGGVEREMVVRVLVALGGVEVVAEERVVVGMGVEVMDCRGEGDEGGVGGGVSGEGGEMVLVGVGRIKQQMCSGPRGQRANACV